jgi:magnesium transporter
MNTVMKFLAAMTIVLTLPVLVASLYGMNVQLPLQEWPYAFAVVIVASVGLAALVARIFIRRDWM